MLGWTDHHARYFLRLITTHTVLYTEMVNTGAMLHNKQKVGEQKVLFISKEGLYRVHNGHKSECVIIITFQLKVNSIDLHCFCQCFQTTKPFPHI